MSTRTGTSTSTGAPRRTLIVSPTFHGYWRSIEDAFRRRGHEVLTVRYDAYDTVGEKLRLKATVELSERLRVPGDRRAGERRRLTDRVIAAMRAFGPDRVLVVKGDGLDERFWDALDATPRVLWLYDDLHRHDHTMDFLRAVGPVVSYSPSETEILREREGVDATFMADAFDPHRVAVPARRTDEIAFVGSGYRNRYEILGSLAAAGLPVHAYGREFSRHLFDRARTWSWARPDLAASRDVPLERAYQIVGEAAAAVNIHGLQTGHAMRTFEIPGMGGVQLVDRDDVDMFYDVGTEVAVWHSVEELIELSRRAMTDRAWAEGLRTAGRARTLAEHTFDHRMATVEALWA
ncbi:CgeB family protein [Brachybacterium huguangmaarense]